MIIVSDTTPLHYLILIGSEGILPALFGEVIIPEAVLAEITHLNAPVSVSSWFKSPPEWVKIMRITPRSFIAGVSGLGKGEIQAIALAVEEKADAVLMDDRRAIREARSNGLTVLTTFAILELAAINNLIDLAEVIAELAKTSFRLPGSAIIEEFLNRDKIRKDIKATDLS